MATPIRYAWSDIMQLMANFRCVMVISMYVDISYNNFLRIYCCYSMQLATIVSTLVYTSIHLCNLEPVQQNEDHSTEQ